MMTNGMLRTVKAASERDDRMYDLHPATDSDRRERFLRLALEHAPNGQDIETTIRAAEAMRGYVDGDVTQAPCSPAPDC